MQEACAKCFAVHILKFEILQTTWKNKTKNIKMLNLLVKNFGLMFFVSFFHMICKISNLNMWTAKHLEQASCTESLDLTFRYFMISDQDIIKTDQHPIKCIDLFWSFWTRFEFRLWLNCISDKIIIDRIDKKSSTWNNNRLDWICAIMKS